MSQPRCWIMLWLLLFGVLPLLGQRSTGELRLTVADPSGTGLSASVELLSQANQVLLAFTTDGEGRYTAKGLPFGIYRLRVQHAGFAPFSGLVEIRSEVAHEYRAVLQVAPLETTVVIADSATLLDPHSTGAVYYLGSATLRERRSAQPARAVLELVESQPGWLLEAHGVLHPRGSEYDTQYIIDGIPIADNRSPAFAPPLEVEELESMKVFTANFPAEYGKRLGGVIEVVTARDSRPGFHGKAVLHGGSFSTQSGYLAGQYGRGRTVAGGSVQGAHTHRFLDPPGQENLTNTASGAGITARLEREFSPKDRLRLSVYRKRTGFLVPNEWLQQQAGQRQDRRNEETAGQFSYQRALSPRLLAAVRGMARDLSAELWSNPLSTPIRAEQQRGFREGYVSGSLSAHRGAHELKAGVEAILSSVHERFGYQITDRPFFEDEIPLRFRFADHRRGREQAMFVQDLVRAGRWTFSAGLRWDHYRLLVAESVFSPRLGIAWHWPWAGLVFRASYDRAFQIPAIENLLLASSAAAQNLTTKTSALPVPPSRGNFYQVGFAKNLFGKLRLDGAYFQKRVRNFADDDVLLNTGVSFPIAFSRAEIHGFEGKLEMPRWGPVSGFVSYSNLVGAGFLPITGGLFLRGDAAELRRSAGRFPITQDQRNTAHAGLRFQVVSKAWVAFSAGYGSGLPIEREGDLDADDLEERHSRNVLRRVNLARGRVRPSFSLDASVGVDLWSLDRRSLRLQADVLNLTDRLNVINFTGLFSGTALAPPRSFSLRLLFEF